MSYITRTGNLAATPTLREGDNGPYTYARVLVSDRIRKENGSYTDGPTMPTTSPWAAIRRRTSSRRPRNRATSA